MVVVWTLSLLILSIGWPISPCIILNKDFKCSMTSDFSLRKLTKEYLKKSSTTTRTYLLPPLLWVGIRSLRSMWIKSKGLLVLISSTFLCELLVCFPFMHPQQMGLGSPLSLGIPLNFFSIHYVHKIPIFMWPSLRCQSSAGSSLALLHIRGVLELGFMA